MTRAASGHRPEDAVVGRLRQLANAVLRVGACLCALLVSLKGTAQVSASGHISFKLIDKSDGLPHVNINGFLHGKNGLLWVRSMQGMMVYDGQRFTTVTHGADKMPIRASMMLEDRDGAIWVAGSLGVFKLDPTSFASTLFDLPDEFDRGVKNNPILAIAWTGAGTLLCGTHRGLFVLNAAQGSFTEFKSSYAEPLDVCPTGMVPDSAMHGVWISTWNQGLAFFDTTEHKLFEHAGDRSLSAWIGEDLVCLADDGRGGLWASAHMKHELWHMDRATRTTRTWTHVPGRKDLDVGGAMFLGCDRVGRVWGCDWEHGFYTFDTRDSSGIALPPYADEYGTVPYNNISAMYEAPTGEFWFANGAGIVIHDPTEPELRVLDPAVGSGYKGDDPITEDVFADGDSLLWVTTRTRDCFRYDLRTRKAEHFTLTDTKTGRAQYITGFSVIGGELYVSTNRGLFTLGRRTLRYRPVRMKDDHGHEIGLGNVRWFVPDHENGMWLHCWDRVLHYDRSTGIARIHVADTTGAEGTLPAETYHSGVCTSDGRFWMGAERSGLVNFDEAKNRWVSLEKDMVEGRSSVRRILSLTCATDGMLWLATDGNGLVRYNRSTGVYTQYDQRHGVSLVVQTISEDRSGRLWLGTFDGLFCFDPSKERAVPIDVTSGVHFDTFTSGVSMSSGGLYYMADRRRILEFDPNKVSFATAPPAPTVNRVRIDGVAVATIDGVVKMSYDKSSLELRYGVLLPPGYITQYAVRASDGEWSESDEGVLNLRGLRPGEYRYEFKVKNRQGLWGPVTELIVKIPPPWWQTLWARILFAAMLAAAIVLVFRARLNWIRKRERAQEEQARQVNELKLQALRAQMDPHFVFNCLNSIDSFIIASDREQASHYLGRFAKLIRLILQHSDSTRVPLEREVEMLKYYLELETLRFKFPFTFAVSIDEELDGEPVELPTMLIQPYIENAIWHGLRHKESSGHISVDFKLHDDQLECTVQDNGIGREASRAINKQRSGVHRSMGMRVSADRLRIYGELEQGASRVTIQDLKDAAGNAQGTRVSILIPLLQNDHE